MPRKYNPKEGVKKRVSPDQKKVLVAVKAVQDGGSFKGTAKLFKLNVILMTLKKMVKKDMEAVPGYKKSQVFNELEEKELGLFLQNMANMYYGLTVSQLWKLAYSYANANNKKFLKSWKENEEAGRDM